MNFRTALPIVAALALSVGSASAQDAAFLSDGGATASTKTSFATQSAPALNQGRPASQLSAAPPASFQAEPATLGFKTDAPVATPGSAAGTGLAVNPQLTNGLSGFSVAPQDAQPAKGSAFASGDSADQRSGGIAPMLGVDVSSGSAFNVK